MTWKIACYIRLSREDGDSIESDSITNQRKLLTSFVDKNFELNDYEFYVDENVTGTKFDREQFNRLLKDIEKGDINCIIVKDLSRFGRNYIDAGILLEDFFPRHNVRFISILDGLDTYTDEDDTTNLMIRIKNLMHDNNSREISRKVRASHALMRNQGKHITHAIYGYKKDPNDKYKLVVDTQVSHVVQWIFQWYASGMGVIRIAQKLNEMEIASCLEYKLIGHVNSQDSSKAWKPNTIRRMLCNHTYIGCVHQGMRTTRNYKDRKTIYLNKDEHIIIENMHEGIIDRQLFDSVQRILERHLKTRTAGHREKVYIFSGFLRCKDCGSGLVRCPTHLNGKEYVYYRCRRYRLKKNNCTHSGSIRHDVVYQAISQAVLKHVDCCRELKSQLLLWQSRSTLESESVMRLKKQIYEANEYIEHQSKLKCTAYEDWKLGTISKEDYITLKGVIDQRVLEKKKVLDNVKSQVDFYSDFCFRGGASWLDDIIQYSDFSKLSREAVLFLIKAIRVRQDQSVDVEFNHCSDIERLKTFLIYRKAPNATP